MEAAKESIVLAIITGTAFVVLFGFFTILVALNFTRHKRKLLHEKQMQDVQFQQAILHARLEMQEHTFAVISQEIHDNVGQILSLAKINLNILTLNKQPPDRLFDVKEQVTTAITELRHLTNGYYPDRLVDMGLVPAIESLISQVNKTGLFDTTFHEDVDDFSISKNKTIFLYRMVQEALNNVVKHSGANSLFIDVYQQEDAMHIILKDNGKGFNADSLDFKSGIGLTSIRQRAAMINASVTINSQIGNGTTVHLICKAG